MDKDKKISIPQWVVNLVVGIFITAILSWGTYQTSVNYAQGAAISVTETRVNAQQKQLDKIEKGVDDMNAWLRDHPQHKE